MDAQKPIIDLSQLSYKHALYALAFLLGLVLRLANIGSHPLTDIESAWALQALELARGQSTAIGPQPLYVLFTGLVFWLVRASDGWARFLPALSGSLLVLLPAIYLHSPLDLPLPASLSAVKARSWEKAGILMSFALALDPALVSLSRQAGSPIPAVAFTLFAIVFFLSRRWRLAGIAGGIALLTGPSFLHGALAISLTWLITRFFSPPLSPSEGREGKHSTSSAWPSSTEPAGDSDPDRQSVAPEEDPESIGEPLDDPSPSILPPSSFRLHPSFSGPRITLYFALGTLLVAGTLLLRAPQSLAALASTLPAYLQGWMPGALPAQSFFTVPVPALRLPLALVVYQPLAVLFAVISVLRFWSSRPSLDGSLRLQLALWGVVLLLLAMLYPARQVSDLAWFLIPLWALASFELSHHLPGSEDWRWLVQDLPVALAHAGMVALFCALFLYNLLRLQVYNAQPLLYAAILIGIFLMVVVVSFLVAAGWTPGIARLGLVWGAALVFMLTMLSSLWQSAYLKPNTSGDLWGSQPGPGQLNLIVHTIEELSEWTTGLRDQIDVLVTVDSPALRWALRNFPRARYADGITAVDLAAVIITPEDQQTLDLVAAYRGQDFTYREYPAWNGLLPVFWLDWLFFREAPASRQQVILWARSDLFPGSLSQGALPSNPFPGEDPLLPVSP